LVHHELDVLRDRARFQRAEHARQRRGQLGGFVLICHVNILFPELQ
jgi:hypothetical protein